MRTQIRYVLQHVIYGPTFGIVLPNNRLPLFTRYLQTQQKKSDPSTSIYVFVPPLFEFRMHFWNAFSSRLSRRSKSENCIDRKTISLPPMVVNGLGSPLVRGPETFESVSTYEKEEEATEGSRRP